MDTWHREVHFRLSWGVGICIHIYIHIVYIYICMLPPVPLENLPFNVFGHKYRQSFAMLLCCHHVLLSLHFCTCADEAEDWG